MIGHVISPNNLEEISKIINNIDFDDSIKEQIKKTRSKIVYNIGQSSKIGANIIEEICNESKKPN